MWDQDQTTEINIKCPYYGHFQIELIQWKFCALLPTINNSLNMFLVESRSLNTNREQIQTNHCTHRARPFVKGRNFSSAAPDTLGGLQQVTRKKAVTVALTLTHPLTGRENKMSTSQWGGFWGTEKHVCSTFIEDYHSLCFAAVQHSSTRSEEQNNMEGKEVG